MTVLVAQLGINELIYKTTIDKVFMDCNLGGVDGRGVNKWWVDGQVDVTASLGFFAKIENSADLCLF